MIVHVKQTNISGFDSSGASYHVRYRGNVETIFFLMFNTCINNYLYQSNGPFYEEKETETTCTIVADFSLNCYL